MSKRNEIIKNIKSFKDNGMMVRDETDILDEVISDEDMKKWNDNNSEFETLLRETANVHNIDYDTV